MLDKTDSLVAGVEVLVEPVNLSQRHKHLEALAELTMFNPLVVAERGQEGELEVFSEQRLQDQPTYILGTPDVTVILVQAGQTAILGEQGRRGKQALD